MISLSRTVNLEKSRKRIQHIQRDERNIFNIDVESDNEIYEYDNFSPIPFRPGDILGIFAPCYSQSRLRM